jgi:hypothetical protein
MKKAVLTILALGSAIQPAHAQMTAPPIPSELPDVSNISPANAAGVLHFCMSKGLVSTTSATAVLGGLGTKPDMMKSPDYTAGAAGRIVGSKTYSIGGAPGHLQSRACDMVLQQAKRFP